MREYLGEIDSSTIGTESLVIIADPVREGDGVEADYSFLEHDAYVRTSVKGTDHSVSPLQDTFERLWADEDYSLGLKGLGRGQDEAKIIVFTWSVATSESS